MYVRFRKWNCFGIVPFQGNVQFNSHSFDSISCQFVIPLQFVEIPESFHPKISIPMPWHIYHEVNTAHTNNDIQYI